MPGSKILDHIAIEASTITAVLTAASSPLRMHEVAALGRSSTIPVGDSSDDPGVGVGNSRPLVLVSGSAVLVESVPDSVVPVPDSVVPVPVSGDAVVVSPEVVGSEGSVPLPPPKDKSAAAYEQQCVCVEERILLVHTARHGM